MKTHISIHHVRFHFFDKMDLQGVFIEDQNKDTLMYAGTVKVLITDWFFFKDKAELKYIGLSDAIVNFNRKDSTWNYNFLGKYFASSDTSTKKSSGIQFDLKKVELDNVSFVQKDAWTGNDMVVKVKSLDMDARQITLTGKTLDIKSLDLVDPYFSTFSYKGLKPSTKDTSTKKSSSPPEWTLLLSAVNITNGRFRSDNESKLAGPEIGRAHV